MFDKARGVTDLRTEGGRTVLLPFSFLFAVTCVPGTHNSSLPRVNHCSVCNAGKRTRTRSTVGADEAEEEAEEEAAEEAAEEDQ